MTARGEITWKFAHSYVRHVAGFHQGGTRSSIYRDRDAVGPRSCEGKEGDVAMWSARRFARTTALVSLTIFALGALLVTLGAVNDAAAPGIGPFLMLIAFGGFYAALCLAVGKVVLPCQPDARIVVTEDRLNWLRPDATN